MNEFTEKISLVFSDRVLRRRIFMTVLLLVIFRLLAAIPIPGVNTALLADFFRNNQYFKNANAAQITSLIALRASFAKINLKPFFKIVQIAKFAFKLRNRFHLWLSRLFACWAYFSDIIQLKECIEI